MCSEKYLLIGVFFEFYVFFICLDGGCYIDKDDEVLFFGIWFFCDWWCVVVNGFRVL